jgi:hypothetical protein
MSKASTLSTEAVQVRDVMTEGTVLPPQSPVTEEAVVQPVLTREALEAALGRPLCLTDAREILPIVRSLIDERKVRMTKQDKSHKKHAAVANTAFIKTAMDIIGRDGRFMPFIATEEKLEEVFKDFILLHGLKTQLSESLRMLNKVSCEVDDEMLDYAYSVNSALREGKIRGDHNAECFYEELSRVRPGAGRKSTAKSASEEEEDNEEAITAAEDVTILSRKEVA